MLWEKDSNEGSDLEGETSEIANEKIYMYLKIQADVEYSLNEYKVWLRISTETVKCKMKIKINWFE